MLRSMYSGISGLKTSKQNWTLLVIILLTLIQLVLKRGVLILKI